MSTSLQQHLCLFQTRVAGAKVQQRRGRARLSDDTFVQCRQSNASKIRQRQRQCWLFLPQLQSSDHLAWAYYNITCI